MDDLIKRGDAIKAVSEPFDRKYWNYTTRSIRDTVKILKDIPSAENKGEWILTDEDCWENGTHALICSECGKGYHLNIERVIGDWNFCPNCGASMRPKLQGTHFDSIIIDECAMKGADDDTD